MRSPLKIEDELIFDIQRKAEKHAQHFQQNMYSNNIFDYTREDRTIIDNAANDRTVTDCNKKFTSFELSNAINTLESEKAVAADNIHNKFLIHLPIFKLQETLGVINRMWTKGYFPKSWKLAQIIPILKPGKNAQDVASYRPISLLSCLSKVVEKMVCNRLTFYLETENYLSPTQYGFRENRSTIDPIINLEHIVRSTLVNRKVTIVVFFYLKSAFDSVNHMKLLRTLADIGIKGNMLEWLISFLTDRKIQVTLEDKISETYNINTGVPQGSTLSPILFILLLSTMPNIFPVISDEFADDIAFAVTADSLEQAETLMQDAIERFLEWCNKTSLTLQPLKTKVMCFTKKKNKRPRLFLNNTEIEVVWTFKYLGMTLDAPTLTWGPHIVNLKEELRSRLNIMRALAGTTWGADRENLIRLYIAIIRSKITYGSQVLISASPSNIYKLEVIQNDAIRLATGAWNSTYIPSLLSEANVIPLDLFIQAQAIKQYYKLKIQTGNFPITEQIFNDDTIRNKLWTPNHFKKPFVLKVEELINNWNLPNVQIETTEYPVIPPWFHIENYIHTEMDIVSTKAMGTEHNRQTTISMLNDEYINYRKIYTDGSKAEDQTTGAGYYVEDINRRECWKLTDYTSITGAELTAIKEALDWVSQQQNQNNIVILSDSQTSLHLIKQRKVKSYKYIISKIQKHIIDMTKNGTSIHIQWIPGHTGIEGNDIADSLANQGRHSEMLETTLETKDINKLIDIKMHEMWNRRWQQDRQHGLFGIMEEKLENWHWTRGKNRKMDVIMTKLRLRCVNLNKYLFKINASDTNLCTRCNLDEREDIDHYLLHCPSYVQQRSQMTQNLRKIGVHIVTSNILLGSSNHDIDVKKKITGILEKYIVQSKRFD